MSTISLSLVLTSRNVEDGRGEENSFGTVLLILSSGRQAALVSMPG